MSTLRTNALEGVDAKNSITIVAGAGNVTTTNVQEGLVKQWVTFDMTNGNIGDSFNTTSITDVDEGDFNVTIANDFANIHYSMGVSGTNSSNGNAFVSMQGQTPTVTQYRLCGYITGGTNIDLSQTKSMCSGDLA